MTTLPGVDGRCDDSAYTEAGHAVDSNISFYAGMNGNYLYICIWVTLDTTSELTDVGRIYFDGLHDQGTAPGTDDRNYSVSQSNATTFSRGDGATWVSCGSWCDPSDDARYWFGANVSYEFKVNNTEAWNGSSTLAGFAIRIHDAGPPALYYWGADNVNTEDPSTWGQILAPEFHDLLVPVAVVGIIYFVARRRRRDADS